MFYGFGGAVWLDGASFRAVNCSFTRNAATWGGAVSESSGSVFDATSDVFESNRATSSACVPLPSRQEPQHTSPQ